MKSLAVSLPNISVRGKILILFFSLSFAALMITGYCAFSVISNVGSYAKDSSVSLGEGVANSSSTALLSLGEEFLTRLASDQANYTNSLFLDTDNEMDLLAAQTKETERNPPGTSSVTTYLATSPPANPLDGAVIVFAPGTPATLDSPEAKTLAGLSGALKSLYMTDKGMTGVYIATDSGMMLHYPGNGNFPQGYDPRDRQWFKDAKVTDAIVWSNAPYVDAAQAGLVLTCAKAVYNPTYGYWIVGSDVSTATINNDFIGQTLGGDGYAVLINQQGEVISRPGLSAGTTRWNEPFAQENLFFTNNSGLQAIAMNMTSGESGIGRVSWNGTTDMYVAYAPVRSMNWSLGIALPARDITEPVNAFSGKIKESAQNTSSHISDQTDWLMTIFFILFTVILAIVLAISSLLSRVITRPVITLKEGTAALGRGDLDYRVALTSGDEFEDLARSFNSMAGQLKANIENLKKTTAEKERYSKELEIAASIQSSFLPEQMPDIKGYEVSAVMIPAMEVGGDFYDFIPADNDKWAFVIADVSGKGVSAALFMAMTRTLLRAGLENTTDPLNSLSVANAVISRNASAGMFVTVFTAYLDPKNRLLIGINAGHNPPLVFKKQTGAVTFFRQDGIAMGVVEEMRSTPQELNLDVGDLVILYTDGVTEAFDVNNRAFGEKRLASVVKSVGDLTANQVLELILSDIREFTGPIPQSDDITLIVLRVLP